MLDELEHLDKEATPGPWRVEDFAETGGYDSMTGSWDIVRPDEEPVTIVDQTYYGQEWCDYEFHSAEAENTARLIVAMRNALPKLLAVARAAGPMCKILVSDGASNDRLNVIRARMEAYEILKLLRALEESYKGQST